MRPVPQQHQDFVTCIGGKNRYGQPAWRLVWEPDRLELVGGAWMEEDGTVQQEMRWQQKYGDKPNYILEKWMGPEHYGSQESWEYENALKLDNLMPELGIQVIGPYPYRGEYEHSFTLSGNLYFYTLEKLIKLNLQGRDEKLTALERKNLRLAEEEKKRNAWKQKVIDIYKDRAPAFYGPVSFAGQQQHTALLDRLDTVIKQLKEGISGEEMKEKVGLGLKQKN